MNGAKSVEVASNGVELLNTALETANASGGGLTGTLKGLSGVVGTLGAKASGAGSAVGGMFSNLGALLATPVGAGAAIAAAVIGAGVLIYKGYKKQQEELIKQATEATKSWDDTQTKIDEYKQKYIDLNKQLQNSNLSESEKIEIKRQLLALQNEITAKYGEQAKGIDLINGGLETQLGILSNITAEEASRNIRDNREAYELAEKEMTRQRTFKVNNGDLEYISQSGLQSDIVKAFKNANFEKTTVGFKFTGDAEEFEAAADKVFKELDKLKDEALLSSDRDIIDGITSNLDKVYKKNDETLQKHRNNYNAYLEQQLYKEGFGDELAEYAKRTQEYNDTLFSGDADKINEAKQRLDEYKGTVKEITDAHSEYGDFFDEVANSVDKTTEKVYNFKSTIEKATDESSGNLTKYQSKLKNTVNDLKTMGLDGVDVRNILQNGGVGFDQLSELAKLYDENFDFKNEDMVNGFVDVLSQLGIVAGGTGNEIDLAKDSFDGFMKSASASIDTLDKVNASLVNSFKSGGLSARIDAETGELTGDVKTIMDAYKVDDASKIFERTADGIILNRDALRELQAEQEKTIKEEFVNRIAEAQERYNNAIDNRDEGAISYWKKQLDAVQLLAGAYDGATSAYQKWVDAQNMGEAGDQYDAIASTALKRGKELYDKSLTGTNEFRSIAQLFSNEDLSDATREEVREAYEEGSKVVAKYFTDGIDGAQAFADKMVELGYAVKENGAYDFYDGFDTQALADDLGISVDLVESALKKLGDYDFDIHFSFGDSSVDDIRAQLKKWSDGGNVDLNVRPVIDAQLLKDAGWEDAGEGAATVFTSTFANEAAELGKEDGIAMNFTPIMTDENGNFKGVLSPSELESYAMDVINGVRSDDLNLQIGGKFEGEDAIQEADETAQKIHEAHEELIMRGEFEFDDSSLVSAEDTYNSLVQKIKSLANINTSVPGVYVDIQNDEQVRELAETLLNLDDEEVKAKLGIEGIDTVDGIINKLKEEHINVPVTADTSGMQVQANTSATVDYSTGTVEGVGTQTAVANYTTGTIEPIPNQTAKLDYSTNSIEKVPDQSAKINYSNGYIEDVPDQSATINYTASISGLGALPDDGEHRTIYINTVQLYKGTVTKSAFQAMSSTGSVTSGSSHANGTLGKVGLKHDETALINELGSEIVVRPSEDSWMIFNDGKPTFAPLKKGDVIFNADLTRQLLEKGEADDYARILSGGSHARGTVRGIAHATVKGGGSFRKTTSSSKKSSSGGGGGGGSDGGGSNSKSNKEANDFKETLDKIEIRIDRLDRLISNFDTVASNVFNNLTTRSDALSKSLYVVGTEIKEQERAYTRYIKQANKVGLDSKLAAKVRKGEIDIQDINDEDTWKKIEEYRKWWNSRHSIHLNAGKLRRHINYNARMKYT